MRVERMARSGCACRRGRRPLSQIRAARPAPMAPEGAHNSWRQSPAASRLAGDLLIKALIDESAKRPAKLGVDEIRHRAAGSAQRGSDAGAGEGCYTDDVKLAGEAYAVMVRSRVPHGVIKSIETSAARK